MPKTESSGNPSANPFTVLSNTPSSLLQNVLNDLNLVADDAEEKIGVFRAEELARTALAETNYKVFLEKQKNRDKPREEEGNGDLNMGIIDSEIRLGHPNSSKVEGCQGSSAECTENPNSSKVEGSLGSGPNYAENEVAMIFKGGDPSDTKTSRIVIK